MEYTLRAHSLGCKVVAWGKPPSYLLHWLPPTLTAMEKLTNRKALTLAIEPRIFAFQAAPGPCSIVRYAQNRVMNPNLWLSRSCPSSLLRSIAIRSRPPLRRLTSPNRNRRRGESSDAIKADAKPKLQALRDQSAEFISKENDTGSHINREGDGSIVERRSGRRVSGNHCVRVFKFRAKIE